MNNTDDLFYRYGGENTWKVLNDFIRDARKDLYGRLVVKEEISSDKYIMTRALIAEMDKHYEMISKLKGEQ